MVLKGYRGRLNHRVRLWTTKMAITTTGISWHPSDTCDGYRGRLKTSELAVIATGIGRGSPGWLRAKQW